MSDSDDWTVLWLPIDAEEAALGPAIADALVRAFGRVDPDDIEFGSRTWDTGPLGDSVMCRLEVRQRKDAGYGLPAMGVFTSDPPPERAILTDLIAVLHDEHRPYQGCAHDCCRECTACRAAWPCETAKEITLAQERLQELAGDELNRETEELGLERDHRPYGHMGADVHNDLDDLCPHCGATKGVCGDE